MTAKPNRTPMSETPGPIQYRKRPGVVEAMRFDDALSDPLAVTNWMTANGCVGLIGDAADPSTLRDPDNLDGDAPKSGWYIDPATGRLTIRTLEGDMQVTLGDYVVRGMIGEFYPCKPAAFDAGFDQTTTSHDGPWAVYNGDELEFFNSETEALASATSDIESFLGDQWDESVEQIVVARITHRATQTDYRDLETGSPDDIERMKQNGWAYMCGFSMEPVAQPVDKYVPSPSGDLLIRP